MDVHEIGNRIKKARLLRNYTLEDIASEIGVAKSTIQRYENGLISKLKLPVLQAIADSLKVNPAWLSGQDVPMIIDESVSSIIKNRLEELNMSLEEVSAKSGVSLHWLQNIDTFTPGDYGDYEIGYDWITKVADSLNLPGSKLRAALAKQEIPVYEAPALTAIESLRQAQEDFKIPFTENYINEFIAKTEHENCTTPEEFENIVKKYRNLDGHGKDMVSTVLDKEYDRCMTEKNKIELLPNTNLYLEPHAAHERTDIEVTEEMKQHDTDFMIDPKNRKK